MRVREVRCGKCRAQHLAPGKCSANMCPHLHPCTPGFPCPAAPVFHQACLKTDFVLGQVADCSALVWFIINLCLPETERSQGSPRRSADHLLPNTDFPAQTSESEPWEGPGVCIFHRIPAHTRACIRAHTHTHTDSSAICSLPSTQSQVGSAVSKSHCTRAACNGPNSQTKEFTWDRKGW